MGVEDLAKAGADKAKEAAGKAADGIKDKITEINDDPVGYAVKKGKDKALDAAGDTKVGEKAKEAVQDVKAIAETGRDIGVAVAEGGVNVVADAKAVADVVTNKDTWIRTAKKIFISSLVGGACTCSCVMAPIVLILGGIMVFLFFIVSGWSNTCPKMDIDDGAMARFVTYYDAFVDASSGWTDASGQPWDVGKRYEVVDENGNKTGEEEKYKKTTPEILAAVDYKATSIADNIPECEDKCTTGYDILGNPIIDPVCLHKCITEAIRCRAGKIRIALQDANKNQMTEKDIDPYRNIVYLGNFQKQDVYKTDDNYEPFDDKWILENYDQDLDRMWKSILTPNLVDAFWNFIKTFGKITLQNVKNTWSKFWGTSEVGAATFFRLTRPELIPVRTGTPGWGTYNTTTKVATGHLKEFIDYAQKNILAEPTIPPTVPPDLYEYIPGKLPEIEKPPLSGKKVACPLLKNTSFSGTASATIPSPGTTPGTTPIPGGSPTTPAATSACYSVTLPNISDEAKYIAALNKFIGSGNPLSGKGALFLASGKASNINPALLVSLARKESSFGKSNIANKANNSFGRKASSRQPGIQFASGRFYKWNSFDDSLTGSDNIAVYIRRVYIKGMGIKTIPDMMMEYAPPSQNATATYIKEIKQWITQIISNAGGAVTCTP